MQEEPQQSTGLGGDEPEPENLEFKPVVKYIGIGLGLLIVFGTEYAMYSVGYDHGVKDATPSASATAQAELNATAVKNLTHFMQLTTESDAVLLDTVGNYAARLAWIENESVRLEAEWSLAQAMVDRGMVSKTGDMLAALFPNVPVSPVWARRAVCVAQAHAMEGRTEDSLSYYRFAANMYQTLQQPQERLQLISDQVELLAASGMASQETLAPLEALQQEAASLGEQGRSLQAVILAYMGTLYRQAGDSAKALEYFEKALAGLETEKTPELATAAVCYGMALMEKGETDKAEAFLRDGVSRLGDDPASASYLVAALRELARLEQERNNVDEALGLLYRAEGAAKGRIPADNPFWTQLYDQRGWLNFGKRLYSSASKDFLKAVKDSRHPELLAQPEEGAGRCALAQGKAEPAIQHLERAIQLRLKYTPRAKADLGRLHLLLGNAYDMVPAHAEDAVKAYTQALEYLPEDSTDRAGAMMCLGYALNQSGKWADAAKVWETLAPIVKEDAALREEVNSQLSLCRRHGVAPQPQPAPQGEDAQADAAPATQPAGNRRRR